MEKGLTFTYPAGHSLYINLTNRCTNKCDFCIRDSGDGVYGSKPLWLEREPSVQEILDDLNKYDMDYFKEIVFCGYGEPTYRMDVISEVGKELKSRYNKPVRINTNGQANLIHKKDVAPMFDGAVDIVSISMNEATAKKYQDVCHSIFGEEAYQGILDFAKCCKPYVKEVVFTVVETTLPDEDIEICRKTAEDIGVLFRVRQFETGKENRE